MSHGSNPHPGSETESEQIPRIYLVSYPKIVFLYPTLIAAILAGIFVWIADTESDRTRVVCGLFMAVFALNLIVFAFDFPRTASLTLFFFLVSVVLGLLLTFRFNDQLMPFLSKMLNAYVPHANATFFFSIGGVLSLLFAAVFVSTQFDYWEVTSNELLHHYGFMSSVDELPASNMKIQMEITDLFEYVLLRAGRLILQPSNEPRPIVLENVLRVKAKEAQLSKILGTVQVHIRTSQRGK